jgi:PAS domain S-box-containing protein
MRPVTQNDLERELLHATFERAPIGIAHCAPDGGMMRVNRRLCELLQYSESALCTMRLQDLAAPADALRALRLHRGLLAGEASAPVEILCQRRDGTTMWAEVHASLVRDAHGTPQRLIAVIDDITVRKRTEQVLRETSGRLESIVRASPLPIWTLDAAGEITSLNPAAEELFDWKAADICAAHAPNVPPERVEERRLILERVLTGETVRDYETQRLRADGSIVHLSMSKVPLRDASGRISGVLVVASDITERRQAAEKMRSLNADLERRVNERTAELRMTMQELEAFAYSVSHDLRSPVRAVEGFTDLLIAEHGLTLTGAAGNLLLRVRGAAMRMHNLIDGLLALSQTSRVALRMEHVDLTALAHQVVAELRAQSPGREVELRIQEGLAARGDATLLRQLLHNVIGNAWKYTSSKPKACIEFGVRCKDDAEREFYVKDDGAGFDMDYVERLFRPFERLHSEADFPGIGVGLATVQRIVRRHGGVIRAEATPGAGATFYFTLGRAA